MKNYFRYMAGHAGRIVKGSVGFAIMAWGYSRYEYPANLIIISVGALVMLLAFANILILAPLFGYPANGKKLCEMFGTIDGVPGEDTTGKHATTEMK